MPSRVLTVAAAAAASAIAPSITAVSADSPPFSVPLGFQSGDLTHGDPTLTPAEVAEVDLAFDDDTYAGGMSYDIANGLLYVVGGTYGAFWDEDGDGDGGEGGGPHGDSSDCFVAVLGVPGGGGGFDGGDSGGGGFATGGVGGGGDGGSDGGPHRRDRRGLSQSVLSMRDLLSTRQDRTSALPDPSQQFQLLHSFRIVASTPSAGADSVALPSSTPEVCSSLSPLGPSGHYNPETGNLSRNLALVGHTEEGGLLTGLREVGGIKASGYGYLLDVNVSVDAKEGEVSGGHLVRGGRLFHSSKAQYPVAVAVPPPSTLPTTSGDDGAGEIIYVAVLDTDDDKPNPRYVRNANVNAQHDLTAGVDVGLAGAHRDDAPAGAGGGEAGEAGGDGEYTDADGAGSWHKYGTAFDVTLLKLVKKTSAEIEAERTEVNRVGGAAYPFSETMKVLWEQPYATAEEGNKVGEHPGTVLADLLYVPQTTTEQSSEKDGLEFLLMVGSTRGYGSAFGGELQFDGSWDGFVTKISTSTGEEMKTDEVEALRSAPHSIRIKSDNGAFDDVIRGGCLHPYNGETGATAGGGRYAYVVGTTSGIMDVHSMPGGGREGDGQGVDPLDPLPAPSAFIWKIDLDAMTVSWKKQVVGHEDSSGGGSAGGAPAAIGMGCAVSPDGNDVYLAGVVTNGGGVGHGSLLPTISSGKDDVFVARLDSSATGSGEVQWIRQVGTAEDEWLAKGGSGGVTTDKEGGVILFGGTRGSFMRRRGEDLPKRNRERTLSDHPNPADAFLVSVTKDGAFLPSVDDSNVSGGNREPNGGGTSSDPTFPDQPAGNVPVVEPQAETPSKSMTKSLGFFLLAVVAMVVSAFLLASAYRVGASRARARNGMYGGGDISHEHVTKYLQDFDEVDVAIRASATGGWHGMYDFGDEHSQLMAGLGKVPDEVTVTLSQISKDGDSGSGGGGGVGGTGGGGLTSGGGGGGDAASVASSASNSLVKDALFFEDDEVTARSAARRRTFSIDEDEDHYGDGDGRRGGGDGDGGGKKGGEWGAGYEGLVEVYNKTWDDRNPHSLGGAGGGGDGAMPGSSHHQYDEENDPKLNEIL